MDQSVAWFKVNSSGNFASAAGSQATSSGCVRMFMEGEVTEALLKILFKIHFHSQVCEKSWLRPQGSCVMGEMGGNN